MYITHTLGYIHIQKHIHTHICIHIHIVHFEQCKYLTTKETIPGFRTPNPWRPDVSEILGKVGIIIHEDPRETGNRN